MVTIMLFFFEFEKSYSSIVKVIQTYRVESKIFTNQEIIDIHGRYWYGCVIIAVHHMYPCLPPVVETEPQCPTDVPQILINKKIEKTHTHTK